MHFKSTLVAATVVLVGLVAAPADARPLDSQTHPVAPCGRVMVSRHMHGCAVRVQCRSDDEGTVCTVKRLRAQARRHGRTDGSSAPTRAWWRNPA